GGIDCVFVGPGSAAAGGVNDSKDRVRSNEIPRINRNATMRRITRQLRGIDGTKSTVRQAGARRTAIKQGLINFNAFFVFRSGAMEDSRRTGSVEESIACVGCRRRKRTVERKIVERSVRFRGSSRNDVRQSRE